MKDLSSILLGRLYREGKNFTNPFVNGENNLYLIPHLNCVKKEQSWSMVGIKYKSDPLFQLIKALTTKKN